MYAFNDAGIMMFNGYNCNLNLTVNTIDFRNIFSNLISTEDELSINFDSFSDMEGGGLIKIISNNFESLIMSCIIDTVASSVKSGGAFMFLN